MAGQSDRELAHWQQWQDRADDVWGWRTPAGQVRAARRARLFRELGRMSPHSVVLEIGAGTGEYTHRLCSHVGETVATDLVPELLDHARHRVQEHCPLARVRYEIHDATRLTFKDSQFDAVFGCSVLHHLDIGRALRETYRVLKPGGWCVFSEPNMLNPQIALQKNVAYFKRRAGDSPDETALFSWQARRLLTTAGFTVISVRYFDFLHPKTPPRWIWAVDRLGLLLERIPLVRVLSGSLLFWAQKPTGPSDADQRH